MPELLGVRVGRPRCSSAGGSYPHPHPVPPAQPGLAPPSALPGRVLLVANLSLHFVLSASPAHSMGTTFPINHLPTWQVASEPLVRVHTAAGPGPGNQGKPAAAWQMIPPKEHKAPIFVATSSPGEKATLGREGPATPLPSSLPPSPTTFL